MRLYRTGKASQLLGISKPTLLRKIKTGEIKAYKVGREYRIPESEIKRLLEGKTLDKVVIYARVSSRDQEKTLRDKSNTSRTTALPKVTKWLKSSPTFLQA